MSTSEHHNNTANHNTSSSTNNQNDNETPESDPNTNTNKLIDTIIQSCTATANVTTRENEILALYDEALELDLEAALLRAATTQSADGHKERGAEGNDGEQPDVENGW